MYLHDYRWSAGLTSQELNVVRKALAFASDENAPDLTEEEANIAFDLARIIGGVYNHKREERQARQQGQQGQGRQPRQPREHTHTVPQGQDQGQYAEQS